MKETKLIRDPVFLVLIAMVIIAVAVLAVTMINMAGAPEKTAKEVLTKVYAVTQQDSEEQGRAMTQGQQELETYLHSRYGNQLTDKGYLVFVNNRIPSTTVQVAQTEGCDLKVSSLRLEPQDALEDSKRYAYTIELQSTKDTSRTYTYEGDIALVKENGQWKVSGASPAKQKKN